MLIELVEYDCKIKGKVRAMKSKMKENVQGANSDGKETGTKMKDLEQKEEINIQWEQDEETTIQKKWREYEKTLGHLQMSQHPNHRDARGEEKEQETENVFEIIMKENFPNLMKEIDIQI